MSYLLLLYTCRHIRYGADGAYAHTHVPCGDGLYDGAHAYGIRAETAQHPDLGGSFILRSHELNVNALMYGDVVFNGDLLNYGDQILVIGVAHIDKAFAELFEVLACKRRGHEGRDMILVDHEITDAVILIDSADGVGKDNGICADQMQSSQRQHDVLCVIALIHMDSALHHDDLLAVDLAEDQLTVVTLHGRYGESLDLAVGYLGDDIDLVCKFAQSAAENQNDVGYEIGLFLYLLHAAFQTIHNRRRSAMGGFRAFSFDRKAGILSILRQLCQRFIYFYPADIWGNNWVICCTICLLLLITGVRQKPFVRFFSALFCIGFIIYFLFVRFYGPLENHLPGWNEVRTQWVNLLFFWGVLLMVFLFQWNAKRAKRFLIFLWLSVPGVLLPLIAVKVITFRYYFCTNLFLIEFALALLASEYSAFDPRLLKVLSILVSISFIAVLIQRFTIYAQIWEGKKDRDARIQQARNGEITRLYFPELPHSEYLWIVEAPDGSEQVPFFREFYQIPDEVEMSNLPFED